MTLNFVTRFQLNNDYNTVFMIISGLIKKKYYIPCIIDKNNTTAKVTVDLLVKNV